MTRIRSLVPVLAAVLLAVLASRASAQEPPVTTEPPPDVANEYRITAYPSYPLGEKLMGIGYIGWVNKPDANYTSYYLASGVFHNTTPHVQLWATLISVYTNSAVKSDVLELRPFAGVKFMGSNAANKWRYYNWTRWEIRYSQDRDSGDWSTVQRLRNQTRLEVPLASAARAFTPKTFYAFTDVEPIWRSDTDQVDPLRLRFGLGYLPSQRVLVEFQYYSQYTRPDGGALAYTDNIWRLNFKILTKKGILSALQIGDID